MDLARLLRMNRRYGFGWNLAHLSDRLHHQKNVRTAAFEQRYYLHLSPKKREARLREWYRERTGRELDLKNPRRFSEKIQYLKLYDSTPLKTKLTDKYQVRAWVEERIGGKYLIPLLNVWERFDDIDFNALPESYVLKATHGCAMNVIVTPDRPLDRADAKLKFDRWLHSVYGVAYDQELQYRDIPPRIIAEKYMENIAGDLWDYKFLCFDGVPKYVQVIQGRSQGVHTNIYDVNWNDTGYSYNFGKGPIPGGAARPKQLDKAIELAAKLSQGFCFVRVDLYMIGDDEIYFGEMTFTPLSGAMTWTPPEADLLLGGLITLPREKYVLK